MNRNIPTLIDGLEQAIERLDDALENTKDPQTALDIESAVSIIEEVNGDLHQVAELIELLHEGRRQFPF